MVKIMEALLQLGNQNRLTFVWILGHMYYRANEQDQKLVKVDKNNYHRIESFCCLAETKFLITNYCKGNIKNGIKTLWTKFN